MRVTFLHTENLAIGYKQNTGMKILVNDINIQLFGGQLVCLLGQNGVGKSTLLRTLINLQAPLDGKVFIKGKPVDSYKPNELSKIISLVLTDPIQTGGLTVTELVALGRSPYTAWNGHLSDEDWAKVAWAIDNTRINYIADKYLHELSDGQMQKALIARAIAQDGDLIILDEPTAHLDLNNRVEIMKLLRDLTRITGKAILVATHELQLALQLADILWLTNFNQPLLTGVPEDMALAGHIENTFYHENFDFDIRTGKATLPMEAAKTVALVGKDEAWMYWTTNALLRNGYKIDPSVVLSIQQANGNEWEILSESEATTAGSIGEMLEKLESIVQVK